MSNLKFETGWSFDTFVYKNYGFSTTEKQRSTAFAQYLNCLKKNEKVLQSIDENMQWLIDETKKDFVKEGDTVKIYAGDRDYVNCTATVKDIQPDGACKISFGSEYMNANISEIGDYQIEDYYIGKDIALYKEKIKS